MELKSETTGHKPNSSCTNDSLLVGSCFCHTDVAKKLAGLRVSVADKVDAIHIHLMSREVTFQ